MLEKMVTALVSRMEEEEFTKREEREFYEYAFTMLAEQIFTVGTLIGIGIIRRQLLGTIVFLLFFFALRKRTGGYHAKRFWQCYLLSVLVYLIAMEKAVFLSEHIMFLYGMLGISFVVIEVIGTVNHPNMDMNTEELEESKKLARMVVMLEVFVIIWMSVLPVNKIYIACMSCAVIMCAISLGVSKMIGQEVENNGTRKK